MEKNETEMEKFGVEKAFLFSTFRLLSRQGVISVHFPTDACMCVSVCVCNCVCNIYFSTSFATIKCNKGGQAAGEE